MAKQTYRHPVMLKPSQYFRRDKKAKLKKVSVYAKIGSREREGRRRGEREKEGREEME